MPTRHRASNRPLSVGWTSKWSAPLPQGSCPHGRPLLFPCERCARDVEGRVFRNLSDEEAGDL